MAFSANMVSQNKCLHRDFPPLKCGSPRLSPKSHSPPRNIRPKRRVTASLAGSKVAADLGVRKQTSVAGSTWKEFAANVSGEWDGYGADFSPQGKAIELPESVVPEAYREWGVEVFDWQTQCPTLAGEDCTLMYKLIKLLPTVGCEADAATRYSVDERNIVGSSSGCSFAFHANGCYVAVWPEEDKGTYKLIELEYCLVDPRNRELRARIVQVVRVEAKTMALQSIRVFCEQWYGPFRNGDQLGGCAIRDSAFASTQSLEVSETLGVWEGPTSFANFRSPHMNTFQELTGEETRKLQRGQDGLVPLPRQLWCSLKEGEVNEICCEVGWLFDRGEAVSSRCIFSKEGTLKVVSLARETLVSGGAV